MLTVCSLMVAIFHRRRPELKRFNSLDGHGIKMLKDNGVEVAVITARDSKQLPIV
ncbi:3-deoxy-D-manno-octulosonate 8-phosphate phosphatase (EC [uncultured Gammaproteobacteria bacterium]|nr:3-deoxy-D-manno-octulosonate 8-phosphate phosphatase (EC [uncultured Gammaproteobacteria bacterium]